MKNERNVSMSIATDIMNVHQEVISTIKVTKEDLHGEDAAKVVVSLKDGRTVTGKFATHPKSSFGGIQFSGPKDVAGLMIAKINSVLNGTHD